MLSGLKGDVIFSHAICAPWIGVALFHMDRSLLFRPPVKTHSLFHLGVTPSTSPCFTQRLNGHNLSTDLDKKSSFSTIGLVYNLTLQYATLITLSPLHIHSYMLNPVISVALVQKP